MNTNSILFGVALVLAIPTAFTLVSEGGGFTGVEQLPRLFEGFTADNVKFVVLTKAKAKDDKKPGEVTPGQDPAKGDEKPAAEREQIVLMREGEKWLLGQTPDRPNELTGVPVQATRVQSDILDHIGKIRRDEQALVAANADAAELERRGVTEEAGTLIRCLDAEQRSVAELYVGKDARGGEWGEDKVQGYFVCRKDRKDIILYEAPYWNVSVRQEDWVDTKIHDFQNDKAKAFSVRGPKGAISFVREEKQEGTEKKKVWKAENPPEGTGAVRQQEVENLLQRFNYVNCQRYLGSLANPMLAAQAPTKDSAEVEVSVTLEDNTRLTMWVGTKVEDKNEYRACFEGKDYLVAIGDWIRTPFADKDPKDLFDPPAPPVTPDPKQGDGQAPAPTPGEAKDGTEPKAGEAPAKDGAAENPDKKGDGK